MATLTLNIYGRGEEKNTVIKKYTAEGYDLTLGTVTDILELVNADNMTDEKKIAAAAVKGAKEINPLFQRIKRQDAAPGDILIETPVGQVRPVLYLQAGKHGAVATDPLPERGYAVEQRLVASAGDSDI